DDQLDRRPVDAQQCVEPSRTNGRGLIRTLVRRSRRSGNTLAYAPPPVRRRQRVVGAYGGGGPPGPFSNPVVKPTRADGTGGAVPWESRSSPTTPCLRRTFCFCQNPQNQLIITGRADAELAVPGRF